MRVTEDLITLTKQLMVEARGVKEPTAEKINLKGFFNTCLATSKLSRTDAQLGGYRLEDYKLDPRLKDLVAPRGVYVDEKLQAVNLLKPYEIDDAAVLGPAEFNLVQSGFIGALRSSEAMTTNLLEASESLQLNTAVIRAWKNGMVHESETYFLPLELTMDFYMDFYYNFPANFVLKEFIRKLLIGLKG